MAGAGEDEFPKKEKKKPYPSAHKLSRKADTWHSQRERKKKK